MSFVLVGNNDLNRGVCRRVRSALPCKQRGKFANRLETIFCDIAINADLNARVLVGGDSINTIAVLMHEIPLEERLKATAEEGRLKYLEIESIDASAILPLDEPVSTEATAAPAAEKLWTPLSGSGFTYSIWIRHRIPIGSGATGNLHVLDLSSTPNAGDLAGVIFSLRLVRPAEPTIQCNVTFIISEILKATFERARAKYEAAIEENEAAVNACLLDVIRNGAKVKVITGALGEAGRFAAEVIAPQRA